MIADRSSASHLFPFPPSFIDDFSLFLSFPLESKESHAGKVTLQAEAKSRDTAGRTAQSELPLPSFLSPFPFFFLFFPESFPFSPPFDKDFAASYKVQNRRVPNVSQNAFIFLSFLFLLSSFSSFFPFFMHGEDDQVGPVKD